MSWRGAYVKGSNESPIAIGLNNVHALRVCLLSMGIRWSFLTVDTFLSLRFLINVENLRTLFLTSSRVKMMRKLIGPQSEPIEGGKHPRQDPNFHMPIQFHPTGSL